MIVYIVSLIIFLLKKGPPLHTVLNIMYIHLNRYGHVLYLPIVKCVLTACFTLFSRMYVLFGRAAATASGTGFRIPLWVRPPFSGAGGRSGCGGRPPGVGDRLREGGAMGAGSGARSHRQKCMWPLAPSGAPALDRPVPVSGYSPLYLSTRGPLWTVFSGFMMILFLVSGTWGTSSGPNTIDKDLCPFICVRGIAGCEFSAGCRRNGLGAHFLEQPVRRG